MLALIIDVGIFLNLFFTGIVFFKEPFEFYISYIPIIILLPIFILKFKFHPANLYILIPLLIVGIFNIIVQNNTFANFLKIFVNIAVSLIFYQYVIQYYEFDIKRIFKIYMKWAFVVCLMGLFQLASFIVGFKLGYDWSITLFMNKWQYFEGGLGLRINSSFSEPSYFGAAMGPALFVSIYSLIKNYTEFITKKQALVIIISVLLSFSSVAFIGLFFIILLLSLNFGAIRYFLIAIPIIFILFFIGYNNAPEFNSRINGLNELFVEGILDNRDHVGEAKFARRKRIQNFLLKVHGSSFVLYNNYHVTKKNLQENPLFGTGLGSHEFAFKKYNLNAEIGNIYNFNTGDANSMFLRTVSEAGILGGIFLILFVFKYFISRDLSGGEIDNYWVISNALLVIIFLQFVRQGNYTFNGFFLYGWMYYYNKQNYLKAKI